MTNVTIITKQGHQIATVAPDLETAKKLLSQPFILVDADNRFTAVAISAIEIFDAVEAPLEEQCSDSSVGSSE
jgi:hypothetical protein